MELLSDRLVMAGRELLDEQGIAAVTIREVARKCGVSHGAPRRHFASRAALLAAVAETCLTALAQHIDAAGRGARGGAEAYIEFARSHPNSFELISRHDLLDASGRNFRQLSLPVLMRWLVQYRSEHPQADEADALAAWVAVHGIAALESRRAFEVIHADPLRLLDRVLT
ncbi:AcrR family transcriptional regulator [Pseudoclavibacter sp. JAI123]|uniref:TetR/AcrR family transcriptional regulator n=1 Tax=Pseudoclavibacter sp. JAI123 TaxID=2723065 RepID=UPI0015CD28F0|nr:TetR/AcrR family transcriptional regulator [Pseudoclavibacter sp. JAI123]NYF14862.1 AcrR family transcriptional regulator [Pseudoclavibacter sp. JAI123]